MHRAARWTAALTLVAATSAGCGGGSGGGGVEALDGQAPAGTTVELAMAEYTYTPATATVPAGTAVRLVFPNRGRLQHEARVGTLAEHESYERDRSGAGADMPSVLVAPGQTDELLLKFTKPGTYVVGCHEIGHWKAGQRATITVR